MSLANPLWGAPRIHGELLKLGIDVGQTSVAKYMATIEASFHKDGEPFCVIMPMASQQWICSSFQPSPFDCSMAC